MKGQMRRDEKWVKRSYYSVKSSVTHHCALKSEKYRSICLLQPLQRRSEEMNGGWQEWKICLPQNITNRRGVERADFQGRNSQKEMHWWWVTNFENSVWRLNGTKIWVFIEYLNEKLKALTILFFFSKLKMNFNQELF